MVRRAASEAEEAVLCKQGFTKNHALADNKALGSALVFGKMELATQQLMMPLSKPSVAAFWTKASETVPPLEKGSGDIIGQTSFLVRHDACRCTKQLKPSADKTLTERGGFEVFKDASSRPTEAVVDTVKHWKLMPKEQVDLEQFVEPEADSGGNCGVR